jgi:hypothetical protein
MGSEHLLPCRSETARDPRKAAIGRPPSRAMQTARVAQNERVFEKGGESRLEFETTPTRLLTLFPAG